MAEVYENETIDSIKLRKVAGGFATGVTVVACNANDEVVGMTANSFVSVSLSPPLVMFSVQKSGSFHELCQIGADIGISILSEHQKGISDKYAGIPAAEDSDVSFVKMAGGPVIDESLGWYQTTVTQLMDAGDHTLVLCKVYNLHRNESAAPLLYYQGYHALGMKVKS